MTGRHAKAASIPSFDPPSAQAHAFDDEVPVQGDTAGFGLRPELADPTALMPWIDADLRLGNGEPHGAPHPAHQPVKAAVPTIPKGARFDPNWSSLSHGKTDARWAPATVRLPDTVEEGLRESWQRTTQDPTHREHGGNVVRTYGGGYEMHHGGPGLRNSYEGDDRDVGILQDHVAVAHTHPYLGGAQDHAGFSDDDFANMSSHGAPLSLLRSGSNTTYMLARTRQFQQQLDAIEKTYDGDDDKLEAKRRAFDQAMKATFEAAYRAARKARPDDWSAAVEAGGVAVAEKYQLLYYKGNGGDLRRIAGGSPRGAR